MSLIERIQRCFWLPVLIALIVMAVSVPLELAADESATGAVLQEMAGV